MTQKSTPPSSSVIGYLRVSTADQNLEKNKADILQLANHHDLGRVRFVEEKISGKVSWRERKLAEVLESLGANDAIVISELSRLGRSMLECMLTNRFPCRTRALERLVIALRLPVQPR